MRFLILLIGIIMLGASAAVFLFPAVLADVLSVVDQRRNHFYIAALRLVFGITLVAGAATTAYPIAIGWLGYLLIAAGIALVVVPQPYTQRIARWWGGKTTVVIRIWMLLPLVIATFIILSTLTSSA